MRVTALSGTDRPNLGSSSSTKCSAVGVGWLWVIYKNLEFEYRNLKNKPNYNRNILLNKKYIINNKYE